MKDKMDRRDLLKLTGMGMMALVLPQIQDDDDKPEPPKAASSQPLIRMANDYANSLWYFDPPGLLIQKGQTVVWQGRGGTVTAYHPSNDNHELRIPENAKPFDSGVVPISGKWEWTFDVEGTYDYFSRYQEILGMVGRIVVGRPGGPAEKLPGYGGREGRSVMFPNQSKIFEVVPSKSIVEHKIIRYPRQLLARPRVVGMHG